MLEQATVMAMREAIWVALQLAGPLLLAALGIGLTVSLIQALTQIQEATLAFLPKLAIMVMLLVFLGPFMAEVLRGFATQLFDHVVQIGGAP